MGYNETDYNRKNTAMNENLYIPSISNTVLNNVMRENIKSKDKSISPEDIVYYNLKQSTLFKIQ